MSFGLDGRTYEIDLNKRNVDKLRKTLAPYVEGGRRLAGSARPARRSSGSNGSDAKAIRAWAAENGVEVSPRGAIPAHVRGAYNASR